MKLLGISEYRFVTPEEFADELKGWIEITDPKTVRHMRKRFARTELKFRRAQSRTGQWPCSRAGKPFVSGHRHGRHTILAKRSVS